MNVNEVEKRTLGSLAFSNATIPTVAGVYLPLAGGTMTGAITSIGANNTSKISFLDVKRGSGAGLYLRFQTDSTAANNVSQFVIRRSTDNADLLSIGATSGDVSVTGDVQIDSALLSNQENTNIDTGAEVVAQVAHATYTAAFFDFVIKKGTNIKSGTVFACHDGTNVEFTETSTNDLGDTSDVTLSVDKTSTHLRLIATVTSDDWSVKSLIRAL